MSNLAASLRRRAKSLLRPLIFRYPPVGLQPERLQIWHRSLIETLEVEGAVVEIGCHLGGTSVVSWQLLKNLDAEKRYVCIDTSKALSRLSSMTTLVAATK